MTIVMAEAVGSTAMTSQSVSPPQTKEDEYDDDVTGGGTLLSSRRVDTISNNSADDKVVVVLERTTRQRQHGSDDCAARLRTDNRVMMMAAERWLRPWLLHPPLAASLIRVATSSCEEAPPPAEEANGAVDDGSGGGRRCARDPPPKRWWGRWWTWLRHVTHPPAHLPMPRRVRTNDPDLLLPNHVKKQRHRDEVEARELQQRIYRLVSSKNSLATTTMGASRSSNNDDEHGNAAHHQEIRALVLDLYRVLYGEGVTPSSRQEFLERYGCTGWTPDALGALLRWATAPTTMGRIAGCSSSICNNSSPRGIVEIGAGNGQWARAITDHYSNQRGGGAGATAREVGMIPGVVSTADSTPHKPFDIVLAYDDMSSLPLHPAVYNARTKPHRQYFYDRVLPCRSGVSESESENETESESENDTLEKDNYRTTTAFRSMSAAPSLRSVLSRWECRGRVLLLVYPPHESSMAYDAVRWYVQADPLLNDTVIYVGEGRGGANANGAFFDLLESGEWTLQEIQQVRPLGSKGYERLHVFTRRRDE
jgi:hypothetical protein